MSRLLMISVKRIWIIKQSGVCLMQYEFDPNFTSFIDENIIGGITASLINSHSVLGLDEGKIETISFLSQTKYLPSTPSESASAPEKNPP